MKKVAGSTGKDSARWYAEGLRFGCTHCGACCRSSEGYVWVGIAEIRKLAAYFKLTVDEFGSRYLRRVGSRYALLDRIGSQDCTFLRNGHCVVHEVRPDQCRAFPFWPAHLESARTWARTASCCEGISSAAPPIDADQIEEMLRLRARVRGR